MFVAAIRQVTGIYDYLGAIFEDVMKGIPTMDAVPQLRSSLVDDAFMAIITPILESEPLEFYVKFERRSLAKEWSIRGLR
jgi:hypothetical protein